MANFILEEQIENVINKKTKDYLWEVISSYRNENYRACIVVLYTTVIFDLLQKIVVLKEIYNDKGAEEILNYIKTQQRNNPKSPEWEGNLIESVFSKTQLISAVEKEELLHLKSERNYAAHPIINIDDDRLELKNITKETAGDLIRKAFEIVFLRDVILAKEISKDIIFDINEFYDRANTDGLEKFLNTKYFKRMTQERKNVLFKDLWKFVFLLDNDECNKNRKSNYWGIVFLYNENKKHYRELIIKEENYYSNTLKLETIKNWSERIENEVDYSSFAQTSRIIYLIKFFEHAPEMYAALNGYAKNNLQQSINHMYIEDDVVETAAYQASNKNSDLFKEQVRLKADAMFLSDDSTKHFAMIFRMIKNFINTKHNWSDLDNYVTLKEENLDVIFYQSEHRGCTEEFLTFLINYCTGAEQYWQVSCLFNYLKRYMKHFKEEHYYIIMAKMNSNSQFYENKGKDSLLRELEKMYIDSFNRELVKEEWEKCLYSKLYGVYVKNSAYSLDKMLELIEKRALHFDVWSLNQLISALLDDGKNLESLKKHKLSSYPKILRVLSDSSDLNYDIHLVEKFKNSLHD
ncbi:MAG: hypothetical protein ACRDA4_07285 [Filifactoraceae bacterium]